MIDSTTPPTMWRLTAQDMTTIQQLRKELLAYARRRTDSTADAEDLLSETIIAAGRTFEHRSTIRHYLYSILKRRVGERLRRKERGAPWGGPQPDEYEDTSADSPGPETQLSWLRNARLVVRSLERVPPAYREVVRLAVHGHSNYEIAAKLGISYNTARSRLSRGNAYLSELLRDDGEHTASSGSALRPD